MSDQAIRVNSGANLDNIDKPLVALDGLKECIHGLQSEQSRLTAVARIAG